MNENLLSIVRFYFAQSVFTSACQYYAVNRIENRKKKFFYFTVGSSAITIILLSLQPFAIGDEAVIKLTSYFSSLLTAASLIFEVMNKEDLTLSICQHKTYGQKYKTLRDEFMALIEEVKSNNAEEHVLRGKKDLLLIRYSELGNHAPSTTGKDYQNTQKALGLGNNEDEQFTWSDQEIDLFLPAKLRLL